MTTITHPVKYITLFALILFAACKKEPAAKITSGHYLNATSGPIGTFTATVPSVLAYGATGAKIGITGTSATGQTIELYINPYSGATGVYSIGGTTTEHAAQYSAPGSGVGTSYSTSGTITLTATTPDIIGTFHYTASDGSTVNGAFNVAAP